jgi:hypothetical protein
LKIFNGSARVNFLTDLTERLSQLFPCTNVEISLSPLSPRLQNGMDFWDISGTAQRSYLAHSFCKKC